MADEGRPSYSTAPDPEPLSRFRRARLVRRIFLSALFAFVLLGAVGLFGVRSAHVSASAGGYRLTIEYAAVTRPGLNTPWSARVERVGGFDGPVTIATTEAYFGLFDENGLDPDPSDSTATDELLVWEFSPPDGDVLTVSFDARWSPAEQHGGSATTAVLVDGRPVVEVRYRTIVMP